LTAPPKQANNLHTYTVLYNTYTQVKHQGNIYIDHRIASKLKGLTSVAVV